MKSHRRCQGHCLNACKMLFHRLIAAFHQHLASLFPTELATAQVTASTWLLQLIRISKLWSDQKQSLKRNHVPQKSADAVARNGALISSPSYILQISEDVFLSLINTPLPKRFVMHYSCCSCLQTARESRHHRVQWWLRWWHMLPHQRVHPSSMWEHMI